MLVKHTGCGMLTFKNEDAYGLVGKNLGCVSPHFPRPSPLFFLVREDGWMGGWMLSSLFEARMRN